MLELFPGEPEAGKRNMNEQMARSFAHCRRVSRAAGSTFHFAFRLLPREKRDAMCALYSFLRHTDDLADGDLADSDRPAERRADTLAAWRDSLEAALDGRFDGPIWPALAETADRYSIPSEYLFDAIDGAELDLAVSRYETFDQLRAYCYRAASVVGLCCIHIWGFNDDRAVAAAEDCGVAFQLTNILRDVREDGVRNRLYLPQEDLRRFNLTERQLFGGQPIEPIARLLRFQVDRAKTYYARATALDRMLAPEGRRIYRAMFRAYRSLLARIERAGSETFRRRVSIGPAGKLQAALGSLVPLRCPSTGRPTEETV